MRRNNFDELNETSFAVQIQWKMQNIPTTICSLDDIFLDSWSLLEMILVFFIFNNEMHARVAFGIHGNDKYKSPMKIRVRKEWFNKILCIFSSFRAPLANDGTETAKL